jgi:3-methyladenine DNA glycosylase AlkC
MAEPLKNQYGAPIPKRIADMIGQVYPAFDRAGFVADTLKGYEQLELIPRAWKIARSLHDYLPPDYPAAITLLMQSLGPKIDKIEGQGMAPFLYLPHVFFVAEYGLEHFELSMQAQYELTQRFTAEFSIRAYLERHPTATLQRLQLWTNDPSPHVRRLVSEGTRPRLPWAPRLREFQKDPQPVLVLLEHLKDDPELYVRRSVANNLNDIGKDHPDILVATAKRWLVDASDQRRWIVNHALRSAIKRAEPGALAVIGFGKQPKIALANITLTPKHPRIGDKITLSFEITNTDKRHQRLLVDLRIHFVKANGKTSPKVFKLKTLELGATETAPISKTLSLAEMTTRKHYPGQHAVEAVINGHPQPLDSFMLRA